MNVERVRRDGDVAVRPRQRWTPAVHAALRHLRQRGFTAAPEPLGFDGREDRVSWIEGDSGPDGWGRVVPEEGLKSMARLLRRLHEVGRGFRLPDGMSWADEGAPHEGGILCHGDPGPWNVAWRGAEPAGLIDWDFVHLGDPLVDVHYALEYLAPFRDDEEAIRWLRYPAAPERAHRIRVFWRAYSNSDGPAPITDLVDGVIAQQRATNDLTARLAAEGIEPQASWMRDGHGQELARRLEWSVRHREEIIAG